MRLVVLSPFEKNNSLAQKGEGVLCFLDVFFCGWLSSENWRSWHFGIGISFGISIIFSISFGIGISFSIGFGISIIVVAAGVFSIYCWRAVVVLLLTVEDVES